MNDDKKIYIIHNPLSTISGKFVSSQDRRACLARDRVFSVMPVQLRLWLVTRNIVCEEKY